MMAGWAFSVRVRSLSGPSHISLDSFCDSASSTSWKTSRAGAKASASALPMPTVWLPCPGKRNARVIVRRDKSRGRSQVKRRLNDSICLPVLSIRLLGSRAIADAIENAPPLDWSAHRSDAPWRRRARSHCSAALTSARADRLAAAGQARRRHNKASPDGCHRPSHRCRSRRSSRRSRQNIRRLAWPQHETKILHRIVVADDQIAAVPQRDDGGFVLFAGVADLRPA